MSGTNNEKEKEMTSQEVATVADDAILAAAEEIIKEEGFSKAKKAEDASKEKLEKSEEDLKGSEGNQDLAGPSGTEGPVEIQNLYNNGNTGTNTQEEQGPISMRGDDGKDKPDTVTGGTDANTQTGTGDQVEQGPQSMRGDDSKTRPEAEGSSPATADANTQSGDHTKSDGNQQENRPLQKMGTSVGNSTGHLTKAEKGNIFKKDTEVDDKQGKEDTSKTKKEVLGKDMNAEDSSGLGRTQGDQSSMDSTYRESEGRMMKAIETLTKSVEGLATRVDSFEKKEDELNKSVTTSTIEVLAKSYNKKIRAQEGQIERLEKSLEDVKEEIKQPARMRETVSNFQAIEKGANDPTQQQTKTFFHNKEEVLEKLEDLRKSGKVTDDDVISYNASNNLTPNARKRLQELVNG